MKNVIVLFTAISIAFSSNVVTANRHVDSEQSVRREYKEHRHSDKKHKVSQRKRELKHENHARAHNKNHHHSRHVNKRHHKKISHKKHHGWGHGQHRHAHKTFQHARRHNHKHHKHSHNKVGYLLGGMVIGAVANEVLSANNHSSPRVSTYTSTQPVTYMRDEYGSCYFVADKPHGRVLTEVASAFCSAY